MEYVIPEKARKLGENRMWLQMSALLCNLIYATKYQGGDFHKWEKEIKKKSYTYNIDDDYIMQKFY